MGVRRAAQRAWLLLLRFRVLSGVGGGRAREEARATALDLPRASGVEDAGRGSAKGRGPDPLRRRVPALRAASARAPAVRPPGPVERAPARRRLLLRRVEAPAGAPLPLGRPGRVSRQRLAPLAVPRPQKPASATGRSPAAGAPPWPGSGLPPGRSRRRARGTPARSFA